MPVTNRPFRRTCRQFVDGSYADGGRARYIAHNRYAQDPDKYVRAFLIIQKDMRDLFEYIDPDSQNCSTYSFRIHAFLMRVCVEIEANLKAILIENGYRKTSNLNMRDDYRKIESSHCMSQYKVLVPYWKGEQRVRQPFLGWANQAPLLWYQAYNASKHDRHNSFRDATFDVLIEAICGLAAVISAQFYHYDFSPSPSTLMLDDGLIEGEFDHCIGMHFGIRYPQFPITERYDFDYNNWNELISSTADPFINYPY